MSTARSSFTPAPEVIEEFMLRMPRRAMQVLRRAAAYREMSCEALARQYIGAGLREAEREYFSDQVLKATEEALYKHLEHGEADQIISEVRQQFRPDSPVRPRGYPVDD